MIKQNHAVDPVIRDLNNYLAAQDQHDIKMERLQAVAEKEFNEMSYIDIIEYQDDFDDLETLFECVTSEKPQEAKSALNRFFAKVKEVFIENRVKELNQEEQKEREADEYMERYYLEHGYPTWC